MAEVDPESMTQPFLRYAACSVRLPSTVQ